MQIHSKNDSDVNVRIYSMQLFYLALSIQLNSDVQHANKHTNQFSCIFVWLIIVLCIISDSHHEV